MDTYKFNMHTYFQIKAVLQHQACTGLQVSTPGLNPKFSVTHPQSLNNNLKLVGHSLKAGTLL